jgi:hypothetical protein
VEGNMAIETEREMLKRIVALLFSFAGLAQRASGRSYPVRCLVLWALRRAEVVARDWITEGSAEDLQWNSPISVLHRNSRVEALHLAQNFRALAHALKREIRLEERLARQLMRGEVSLDTADAPARALITSHSIARLTRTTGVAMRCLRGLGFKVTPRLDTS